MADSLKFNPEEFEEVEANPAFDASDFEEVGQEELQKLSESGQFGPSFLRQLGPTGAESARVGEAIAQGFISGTTFGAAELLPGQREQAAQLAEEQPGATALGVGLSILNPASLPRVAPRIIQSLPKALKALGNTRKLKAITKDVPGVAKSLVKTLSNNTNPNLVSEGIAAMALAGAETGETADALTAGGAVLGFGGIMKAVGMGIGKAAGGVSRASFADPEVSELLKLHRTNPTRFKALMKGVDAGDARLLQKSLDSGEAVVKRFRVSAGSEKNAIIRNMNSWLKSARREVGIDFADATETFIKTSGDSLIEVGELAGQLDDIINSAKAQQIDPTDLLSLRQSLGKITEGTPNTISISKLLDVRKLAQGKSNFGKIANADSAISRRAFGAIAETIKKQNPEYSQILSNYANTINPLNKISGKVRISGKTAPGKVLDRLFNSAEEEADLAQAFDEFVTGAAPNRESLRTSLKTGMAHQQALMMEGRAFQQLTKQLPRDAKQLRRVLLQSSLDDLDNPFFVDLAERVPQLAKVRDEIRGFKVASQILGKTNNVMGAIAANPKFAASTVLRADTLKKLALENPEIAQNLTEINNLLTSLSRPGKTFLGKLVREIKPNTFDIAKIIPILMSNKKRQKSFEQRDQMLNAFLASSGAEEGVGQIIREAAIEEQSFAQ